MLSTLTLTTQFQNSSCKRSDQIKRQKAEQPELLRLRGETFRG